MAVIQNDMEMRARREKRRKTVRIALSLQVISAPTYSYLLRLRTHTQPCFLFCTRREASTAGTPIVIWEQKQDKQRDGGRRVHQHHPESQYGQRNLWWCGILGGLGGTNITNQPATGSSLFGNASNTNTTGTSSIFGTSQPMPTCQP